MRNRINVAGIVSNKAVGQLSLSRVEALRNEVALCLASSELSLQEIKQLRSLNCDLRDRAVKIRRRGLQRQLQREMDRQCAEEEMMAEMEAMQA